MLSYKVGLRLDCFSSGNHCVYSAFLSVKYAKAAQLNSGVGYHFCIVNEQG